MQPTIFKFIFKHSKKEQLFLLVLTLLSFPFLYVSLELPKQIVNEAIGGTDFPRSFFGQELDQVPYLLVLCVIFLLLVLINGGFKYAVNVYRGVVGERMLRRLRFDLFARVLRFPLPQFRKTSQGELVSMIAAETEPLGGFVGDSIALPAFQGGTLLTLLVFMFVQDWVLGVAAILLYPLQMWVIPKLQRQVNLLKKERTIKVRRLSERIGDVVNGIQEIHVHDTSRYELADYSSRMGEIYQVRYQIYRKKFFIKFLNNFIAQVTPFFFFSIGGVLVIEGKLSFGALVAVLAAYKDLSGPWKELLTYYQLQSDARIKYELLVDTFQPEGMLEESLQGSDSELTLDMSGEYVVSNLDLREPEEGDGVFSGTASLRLPISARTCIVGDTASGTDRLAMSLAGLKRPMSGSITVAGHSMAELPESFVGRHFAYVGQDPKLRSGTLKDNLYYGLVHKPQREADYDEDERQAHEKWVHEARASGNAEYDLRADWIDYDAAGVSDADGLTDRAIEVLSQVGLDDTVYQLGLHGTVNPEQKPDLARQILEAREELQGRLADPAIASLVEPFDKHKYNTNMSVAENLMFGTPTDKTFDLENLADNAYVRKVLYEEGLMDEFLEMGRQVAEVMVDLFADVEPGSELFEQFSFISFEDLPDFRKLLSRSEPGNFEALESEERRKLVAIPFRLVVARHRLGLIDESFQQRLLKARELFERGFGEGSPPVEFFERARYNQHVSIQDNILFGRLAYGRARAAAEIGNLIGEVVERRGLTRSVTELGLDYPIGIAGSRLNASQRQKLSIARCMLKNPSVLVVDEATAALDENSQNLIMENLLQVNGRGLIWVLHRASLEGEFDQIVRLDSGKVVYAGPVADQDVVG